MSNKHEYYYANADSGHHHKYLINSLLEMMYSASPP
jgi:hypothetical protein